MRPRPRQPFTFNQASIDHGTFRRFIEVIGTVGVAARIAAGHWDRFGRCGIRFSGGRNRLGSQAGSVHCFLPVVSHQEAAEPVRDSLPVVQRQHQSTLWKLWQLLLLSHGDGLLQRHLHQYEFGSAQLRCLRARLRRTDSVLQSRSVRRVAQGGLHFATVFVQTLILTMQTAVGAALFALTAIAAKAVAYPSTIEPARCRAIAGSGRAGFLAGHRACTV